MSTDDESALESQVVHVPVPGKLLAELDSFLAKQEFPVTRVAVMRRALEQFLKGREPIGSNVLEETTQQILDFFLEQRGKEQILRNYAVALARAVLAEKKS